MFKMKQKVTAALMAAVTALSILTPYVSAEEAFDVDVEVNQMETIDETETEAQEYASVSIEILTENGKVTVDRNTEDEQSARIELLEKGEKQCTVFDADGHVVSQQVVSVEKPYALTLNLPKGTIVEICAEADDGYRVGEYKVTIDGGADEPTSFREDEDIKYIYQMTADADKTVKVGFSKQEMESTETAILSDETEGGISVQTEKDQSEMETDIILTENMEADEDENTEVSTEETISTEIWQEQLTEQVTERITDQSGETDRETESEETEKLFEEPETEVLESSQTEAIGEAQSEAVTEMSEVFSEMITELLNSLTEAVTESEHETETETKNRTEANADGDTAFETAEARISYLKAAHVPEEEYDADGYVSFSYIMEQFEAGTLDQNLYTHCLRNTWISDYDSEYTPQTLINADRLFSYVEQAYENGFLKDGGDPDAFAEAYSLDEEELAGVSEMEQSASLTELFTIQPDGSVTNSKTEYLGSEVGIQIETGSEDGETQVYEWDDVQISGYVENGAVINQVSPTNTNIEFSITLTEGAMAQLTDNGILTGYTNHPQAANVYDTSEEQTGIVTDYAWQILDDGTIMLYFYPEGHSHGLNEEPGDDEFACMRSMLIPDSSGIMLLATTFPYTLHYKNHWADDEKGNLAGGMMNENGKTFLDVLDIDYDVYRAYLEEHLKDDYYIGTPYNAAQTYPNGEKATHPSYGKGMQCTGFVWHVLWRTMDLSDNGKIDNSSDDPSILFGDNRNDTYKWWTTGPRNNNLWRGYFHTKKGLMNIGKPQFGDLIYIMATGEDNVGTAGADNHIGIYVGDGQSDLFWHSSQGKDWCDGTIEGIPDGHFISVKGNSVTEIVSKQKTTCGYILIKAAEQEEFGGLRLRKRINNPSWASLAPTVSISTEFSVWKNEACTKPATFKLSGKDAEISSFTVKEPTDVSTEDYKLTGMEAGTYYLKEEGRCNGCISDTRVYSFEITEGKTTKKLTIVKSSDESEIGKTVSQVTNIPAKFRGTIAAKIDKDTEAGLEGAVFKVVWTNKTREKGGKDIYTWYFKSDADGKVNYDNAHYLDKWKNKESDDLLKFSNGYCSLPEGHLYITEVEAPKDYIIDDTTEHHLELKMQPEADDPSLYLKNNITVDSPIIFKDTPESQPVTVMKTTVNERLALTKLAGRDNPMYSLAGAVYTAYNLDGTLAKDKDGQDVTFTTKADGSSNSVKMLPGDYYLVETNAPHNFALDNTPVNFTVGTEAVTIAVTDMPVFDPGVALLVKADPRTKGTDYKGATGNQDFSTARFRLSYWAQKTADGQIPSGEPDQTWVFSPEADGKLMLHYSQYIVEGTFIDTIENAGQRIGIYPVGTYKLEEIQAATGYKAVQPGEVVIMAHNDQTEPGADRSVWRWEKAPIIEQDPEADCIRLYEANPVYGDLEVQKVDIVSQKERPQGDASLAGIQFAIYNKSQNPVIFNGVAYAPEAEITALRMTTNENGYATTKGMVDGGTLPYGAYEVQEIATNASYLLTDGERHPVTVGDDLPESGMVRISAADDVIHGGLAVQKLDLERKSKDPHADANLSGAEFTIINASDESIWNKENVEVPTAGLSGDAVTYDQIKEAIAVSKVQVITTDANGYAATGNRDLPYGTYYVIETKAPAGYFCNESWIGYVQVREDGKIYDIADGMRVLHSEETFGEACEQIYRGGIQLLKSDMEMKTNVSQGEAVLVGAEFTIINASKASARNKDGQDIPPAGVGENPTYRELRAIADQGVHTMQTIVTDESGSAKTGAKDLPYGTYYIIETKSSFGYYIDDSFVGKAVIRDDGVIVSLGASLKESSFMDLGDTAEKTVNQQIHRSNLYFLKVNIDGEYKPYIPFLISAIRVNADGTEEVLESHVIVSDASGCIDTARTHSVNVNGFDGYVQNGQVTEEGERHLKEASAWGIWFEGNADMYPKNSVRDDFGALYTCHYRITELHCNDNRDLGENLLQSELIFVDNDTVDLTELMEENRNSINYHPLVDTEIVLTSKALDAESNTKTVPARSSVKVTDTISYTHVSADHQYRMHTQFVDLTDNGEILPVLATDDEKASVSSDGKWLVTQFQPQKQSGTNNTYGEITVSAYLDTSALRGHTIMAVDHLYQYIDISERDDAEGNWILVKQHPAAGEVDEDQYLYVPDLHTNARDGLTGDRVGTKSKDDRIIDEVSYVNLSQNEQYIITMTVLDAKTGEALATEEDGNVKTVRSKVIYKRDKTPISGSITMPEYAIDTSNFTDNKSAVVVEMLYRADEDGNPMGEPLVTHNSLLDEDETIRWIDVHTSASDLKTADDVGASEEVATVVDRVQLTNVIFDDNDHDGQYVYTVKGRLVYQKDFTDANGKAHKEGETVESLKGTWDTVTICSDAAGNAVFTFEDGSKANGKVTITGYGLNVAKGVHTEDVSNNAYIPDPTAAVANVEVDLIYKVDAKVLEGGSVVVFETLYHDVDGRGRTEVADHEEIGDKGQTVHYPKVQTSASDMTTTDDVGTVRKEAAVKDVVLLKNLVPGRSYMVKGKLYDQETGQIFLTNGQPVERTVDIRVSENGELYASDGARTEMLEYNSEKNEVTGSVELIFTFPSQALAGRTLVVFENLYHNNIQVACHNDLFDKGQSVHYPKIGTTLTDGQTKDHVGTTAEKAVLIDAVKYENLVIGRTYTLKGTLLDKATGEPLKDKSGETVTAQRTFVAGEKADGIIIEKEDNAKNRVDGSVDITFCFDASMLEGITVVAYEDLIHNGVEVTVHHEIADEEQTVHFPKIRTKAADQSTTDDVGKTGETRIVDQVQFTNLIPGHTYEISGTLMDADTGEPYLDGKELIQNKTVLDVHVDGTVTASGEETVKVDVTNYDIDMNQISGTVELVFTFTARENKTLVVFEELYHNEVKVAVHADINDLGQTVHFPQVQTTAEDVDTGTHAGTVKEKAVIADIVKYNNLVLGKTYTLKGTLMNQETGLPFLMEDGTPVTAEAEFIASVEGDENNKVTEYDETRNEVNGEYMLYFEVDSRQLAGKTIVVYEDLIHNEIIVAAHGDLYDHAQSVHFPQIHTMATDRDTKDHVGSVFGSLINGIRKFLGWKEESQRRVAIIDTVALYNLVPGLTYVVSGKLYDVDKSREMKEPAPLLIDGLEVVKAVTFTVSLDGKEVVAADGSRTEVLLYDETAGTVDAMVELTYEFDSSKAAGTQIVVFEELYQDADYAALTDPNTVKPEDLIHRHADIEDQNQSVSEVDIHTTAVDKATGNHVGAVPGKNMVSVVRDEVNLGKLLPGMEYEIRGVLVDMDSLATGKARYLKPDGTLTDKKEEAYTENFVFTAEDESETHYLNFALASDKVQGMTFTVFEDLLHNGAVVSAHPGNSAEGWDVEALNAQTVYYPAGKTNATDNVSGTHSGFAGEILVITDKVYFENLLAGESYEIAGSLLYQSDFTDANGAFHAAGTPVITEMRTVRFTAAEDLREAEYVVDGMETGEKSPVEDLVAITYPDGKKGISGYVRLSFMVDAQALEGATVVAYETFYNNGTEVFVHKDLTDLPQTVKIPKIQTNAKSLSLDEASVYDSDGKYRDIEITDTVTYYNLWTKDDFEKMKVAGKRLQYLDGSVRDRKTDIYTIDEPQGYVLKGTLMDKQTNRVLEDASGNAYTITSKPFLPETENGTYEITFTVNAGDFVQDGKSSLEGKSIVVFEDLYLADKAGDTEDKHVAEHHDIEDQEQDIRFPKGRTHATDGIAEQVLQDMRPEKLEVLHAGEAVTCHEVLTCKEMTVTDLVSYENLHGAAKYTVKGQLMVITKYDKEGKPKAYEPAKDDNGKEIVAEAELDTGIVSQDYNANVSGSVLLTFRFSGEKLAGKTTVVFETFSRDGGDVIVHHDITDNAQTVYIPSIQTDAADVMTGLKTTVAGMSTVIVDKVSYENLEAGKSYTLEGVLHRKSDGLAISGAQTEGEFVAGVENQFILRGGTQVMTIEELREKLGAESMAAVKGTDSLSRNHSSLKSAGGQAADEGGSEKGSRRVNGEVYVVIPIDTSMLGNDRIVAFETLYSTEEDGGQKTIAEHHDLEDEDQTVTVTSPGGDVPTEHIKTGDRLPFAFVIAGGLALVVLMTILIAYLRRRRID